MTFEQFWERLKTKNPGMTTTMTTKDVLAWNGWLEPGRLRLFFGHEEIPIVSGNLSQRQLDVTNFADVHLKTSITSTVATLLIDEGKEELRKRVDRLFHPEFKIRMHIAPLILMNVTLERSPHQTYFFGDRFYNAWLASGDNDRITMLPIDIDVAQVVRFEDQLPDEKAAAVYHDWCLDERWDERAQSLYEEFLKPEGVIG